MLGWHKFIATTYTGGAERLLRSDFMIVRSYRYDQTVSTDVLNFSAYLWKSCIEICSYKSCKRVMVRLYVQGMKPWRCSVIWP